MGDTILSISLNPSPFHSKKNPFLFLCTLLTDLLLAFPMIGKGESQEPHTSASHLGKESFRKTRIRNLQSRNKKSARRTNFATVFLYFLFPNSVILSLFLAGVNLSLQSVPQYLPKTSDQEEKSSCQIFSVSRLSYFTTTSPFISVLYAHAFSSNMVAQTEHHT
jgi:hypothetical protein